MKSLVYHVKEFVQHFHVQNGLWFEHAITNIFSLSGENPEALSSLYLFGTSEPYEKATMLPIRKNITYYHPLSFCPLFLSKAAYSTPTRREIRGLMDFVGQMRSLESWTLWDIRPRHQNENPENPSRFPVSEKGRRWVRNVFLSTSKLESRVFKNEPWDFTSMILLWEIIINLKFHHDCWQ